MPVPIRFFLVVSLYLNALSASGGDCVNVTAGVSTMHMERIFLMNDKGRQFPLDVLVADDPLERASGFQQICPEVIEHTWILFRFARPVRTSFHMSNVHAPLDIAFMDADGHVVGVRRMETYTGQSRPVYGPGGAFQYALEAPAGYFRKQGVSPRGSRMILQ